MCQVEEVPRHSFRSVTFFRSKPGDIVAPPPYSCIALIPDMSVQVIKLCFRRFHPDYRMQVMCKAGSKINFLPHLPETVVLEKVVFYRTQILYCTVQGLCISVSFTLIHSEMKR